MRTLVVAGLACGAWAKLLFRSPLQVRHVGRWFSTILAQKRRRAVLWDALPWFTFDALRQVEAVVGPGTRVFEWGTGVSTIWLARRCAHVVSVEHDPAFHPSVRAALEERGLRNCRLELRELGGDDLAAQQEAYAAVIDEFEDGSFDLVIIDGRARTRCAAHAMSKVAPGGLLLLDNADRPRYQDAFDRLAVWPRENYFGPGPYMRTFWKTSIWRRPAAGAVSTAVDEPRTPVDWPSIPVAIDYLPNRVASEPESVPASWDPSSAGAFHVERPELEPDQHPPGGAGLSVQRAASLAGPIAGEVAPRRRRS